MGILELDKSQIQVKKRRSVGMLALLDNGPRSHPEYPKGFLSADTKRFIIESDRKERKAKALQKKLAKHPQLKAEYEAKHMETLLRRRQRYAYLKTNPSDKRGYGKDNHNNDDHNDGELMEDKSNW